MSAKLGWLGVAVFCPPPSQSDEPPYLVSGPRFYVSVTAAAASRFGSYESMPPMPPSLRAALWPRADDFGGAARIRGLGWALAPAGSDPQLVHADLWGSQPKQGRVRFPHLLWKRDRASLCTTEVVRGGFTDGVVGADDYEQLTRVRSPAILVDSEALHRGGPTAPPTAGAATTDGWMSTCSVELCSASGWKEWLRGTGGTVADPQDPEYRMLQIMH